jgi:hypothetical protein
MKQDFFAPRLSGARFEEHTVPADILPDIAALQEMLVELAKAAYLEEHPHRVRAPRNFSSEIQVHLAGIDDGSARLKLVLVFAGLLTPYEAAFQKAQAQITQAIEDVARGDQPTMSQKYLAYFERLGRGLLDGESLEFPTPGGYASLNRESRRALIQAAQVQEWTERATVRVRIPMTDYRMERYEAQLPDGTPIPGKLIRTIYEQLADAHRAYGTGQNEWLLVQCVVVKDRSDKIKSIESVEHVAPLDPLDVTIRIQELARLEEGWLGGQGKALSRDGLDWLERSLSMHFGADLPLPHLYPTPEANVLAEWKLGRKDIALEINLGSKRGDYSILDLDSGESAEDLIELGNGEGWRQLNDRIEALRPTEETQS